MDTSIEIREIGSGEIHIILPMVEMWNEKVAPTVLAERLNVMLSEGYRCIGAFDSELLVGIAGLWVGCQFWCGSFIQPDNVIVLESRRGEGIGTLLLNWIHDEGRRIGCDVAVLDSYIHLVDSHRFYERLGYEKPGYHFLLRL